MEQLAQLADGYSGADVHVACREASMMPMRRLISMLDPMVSAHTFTHTHTSHVACISKLTFSQHAHKRNHLLVLSREIVTCSQPASTYTLDTRVCL